MPGAKVRKDETKRTHAEWAETNDLHGIVKRLYQKNGEQMYKFKEDETIKDIEVYIKTYSQHYSNGKYQATDMIIDSDMEKDFVLVTL